MPRQSKTWVSQGKRFIGEEMSMKDEGEWAGRAFRLGCRYETREGGEAGRKAGYERSQVAVVSGGPRPPTEGVLHLTGMC